MFVVMSMISSYGEFYNVPFIFSGCHQNNRQITLRQREFGQNIPWDTNNETIATS